MEKEEDTKHEENGGENRGKTWLEREEKKQMGLQGWTEVLYML